MLVWIPVILTDIFLGYFQSLRFNAGTPLLVHNIFVFQIISNLLFTNTTTKMVLRRGVLNYLFTILFLCICFILV
jgi:hypothetical protein